MHPLNTVLVPPSYQKTQIQFAGEIKYIHHATSLTGRTAPVVYAYRIASCVLLGR